MMVDFQNCIDYNVYKKNQCEQNRQNCQNFDNVDKIVKKESNYESTKCKQLIF